MVPSGQDSHLGRRRRGEAQPAGPHVEVLAEHRVVVHFQAGGESPGVDLDAEAEVWVAATLAAVEPVAWLD